MSGVSQGAILGLVLFIIFVDDMDSGIESTLSKSADDAKLCGAVNMLKGRDAIQRSIEKLKGWACDNLMKFNKVKYKVLQMGQGNPKHKYRLGGEWIESNPEKDLGVLADERLNMTRKCSLTAQANCTLGCIKSNVAIRSMEVVLSLCSGESPPGVLDPALEASAQDRRGPVGVGPEEATKMIRGI